MPEEPPVRLEGLSPSPARRPWAAGGHAAKGHAGGPPVRSEGRPRVHVINRQRTQDACTKQTAVPRSCSSGRGALASRINGRRCYGRQQSLHGDRSEGSS